MTSETEVTQPEAPRTEPHESGSGTEFATAAWDTTQRLARWTGHQSTRPRARTLVVGVALILVTLLFVAHSFWTAPLVIIGIIMIIIAWVGSRLEGRFAIEWSELGTGFEMHARFKSANARPNELTAAPTPAPETPDVKSGDDDDVIEGEAHTMEIPAEELRALVAALEQVAPQAHRPQPSEVPLTAPSLSTPTQNSRTLAGDIEDKLTGE